MILTGRSRLAGVLGWPVAHSRSPRLHGYWLDQHAIDGAYVPLPTAPEDLVDCVRALPRLGFMGANVTVPHKQGVLAACDRLDDHARRLGAVNTLVFDGPTIEGRNTDGVGFLNNLYQRAPNWGPAAGPAVVLGAGGAARAVVIALADAGVPEIRLANRTRTKADTLAAQLDGPVTVIDWDEKTAALEGANLLVNTTSLGMIGHGALEIDLTPLPPHALVNDIVYQPLETDLLARARARGNPVVDGIGMLLHQAVPGFAAWFGVRPEVTETLRDFVLQD
ncbi:shikimate dehydrogenase [Rhodovibrio salinarum]|uniref:Shikimate dehydrogenase (NADP(+)) n=1 Tax=Rhodovibrio salinarum TaxID=1087 RepID=A0A934UZY8_9PROT|nr:shikimate dehydrogenase [Rhodovibrio salinarum]MBK1696880.1 shikimate dehydrogenase [Rhodovibrio salinarum]